jgi:hypothetical protein
VTAPVKRAVIILAALLVVQLLANALLLRLRADELNHLPHHYALGVVESARGTAPADPARVANRGLFFAFATRATAVLGLSPWAIKFTTTFYWLAALTALALAGWWLAGPRVGWLAAATLSAMAFANNFSRAFDVHVPRFCWELVVLAGLVAYRRYRAWPALAVVAAGYWLGLRYSPGLSDSLLFLLGVAAPTAYLTGVHLFELWREGRRKRRRFWLTLVVAAGLGLRLVVVWVLNNPNVSLRYVAKETARHAVDSIAAHAAAYPAFLAAIALGAPVVLLLAVAAWPALRVKHPAAWVWLVGALAPLVVLTFVAKKNGYYLAVILPYLALGIALGLDRLIDKRRWVLAPVALLVLAGNVLSWGAIQPQFPLGPLVEVFQSPPTDGYQAAPLKAISRARRERLRAFAESACADRAVCRIAWVGVTPDELEIYLPTAIALPRAVLVGVLDPVVADPAPPFALAVVNTAAFGAAADEDFPVPFAPSVAAGDPATLAAALEQGRLAHGFTERYAPAEERVIQALTGLRFAGRFDDLDYFTAP